VLFHSAMENKKLQALVAHLHIIVKKLTSSDLSGDFASAFKGSGLEFAHIRNYEQGDEIRSIDWKSSAKMNRLMVKEFVQERERTVIIALDLSSSLRCGSQEELKESYARTTAACLALMAQNTNDKVGLLLFAGAVIKYLPPRKGASYAAHLINEIFSNAIANGEQTSLATALKHLAGQHIRNSIIFIVSDWITPESEEAALLNYMGRKNEAVAVRIIDPLERHLPDLGVIPMIDPETGDIVLLNTSGTQGSRLNALLGARLHDQKSFLKKHHLAVLDIEVGCSLTHALATFFHARSH